MQPFIIEQIEEIFIDSFPYRENWPAGTFQYQLTFYQKLTKEQENSIAEWLAINCKENFIFSKDVGKIIAGGCSDNLIAWKQRRSPNREAIVKYCIRLYRKDIWYFRMVWTT